MWFNVLEKTVFEVLNFYDFWWIGRKFLRLFCFFAGLYQK